MRMFIMSKLKQQTMTKVRGNEKTRSNVYQNNNNC